MEITTDLLIANSILQRYSGATCGVCIYSTTLRRIGLKLILPEINEVVFVVGVSCRHITGYFDWVGANLSITVEHDEETNEGITKIVDKSGGFELITSGGFSVAHGLETEFGSSFEDFIKEKK